MDGGRLSNGIGLDGLTAVGCRRRIERIRDRFERLRTQQGCGMAGLGGPGWPEVVACGCVGGGAMDFGSRNERIECHKKGCDQL